MKPPRRTNVETQHLETSFERKLLDLNFLGSSFCQVRIHVGPTGEVRSYRRSELFNEELD